MSGVYLIQQNDKLVELVQEDYDSEDLLQRLLANYPNLLAGDQINRNVPRRWLLVKREAPIADSAQSTGRWSVDHLFLDQDGVPTLVEVKRSSDTRIRREVVGQMLDYAANAVSFWSLSFIQSQFEACCQAKGRSPQQVMAEFLADSGFSDDAFWNLVATNLSKGKLRLLFVADTIPSELQSIVEFLNRQMNATEVLAIEVKQFTGQGLKALVPRVIGQTVEAQQVKSGLYPGGRQWDEPSFFEDLEAKKGAKVAEVGRRILEWALANTGRVWWGKGKDNGSFVPCLSHGREVHYPFAVWSNGSIEIYFQHYKAPFDSEVKKRELLNRLNAIQGVSIPESALSKRPNIQLAVFSAPDRRKELLAVFNWFIAEIKAS